jgi:low temperature requirement protein LtrA
VTDSRHLRARDGSEQRATTFELFFDLVFVFAITQISHYLISHLSFHGVLQSSFLLLVVWWAWIYTTWMTNWFDPDVRAVRLLLIGVMGLGLLMSVAIPEAFGDRALLFAGSYVALQVARNLFNVLSVRTGSERYWSFLRLLLHSVASGSLYIAGALIGGDLLVPLWITALVLDYAGPYLRYWVPVIGASSYSAWDIQGEHFAERFQLLVIIALGESIVVTGATAARGTLDQQAILGILVAFLTSAALWWIYFNYVAERSRVVLHQSDNAGKLARDAFTYAHLPIVFGIILTAVSDELLVAHPDEPYPFAILAIAGPALYLLGHNLFRLVMARSISMSRLIATFVLLSMIPLADTVSALWMSVLVLVVLVVLIVREHFIPTTQSHREAGVASAAAAASAAHGTV